MRQAELASEGLAEEIGLVIPALLKATPMKGYWYHEIGLHQFGFGPHQLGEAISEPLR